MLAAGSSTPASAANCPVTPNAVVRQNAAAAREAKKLLGNPSYTSVIRTFTPQATTTSGFTGYETIVVSSPKGTSPVVGYFTRSGAEPCSVVVTSAGVVLGRHAYVMKLKFPGQQGNPGKLKVTLISSRPAGALAVKPIRKSYAVQVKPMALASASTVKASVIVTAPEAKVSSWWSAGTVSAVVRKGVNGGYQRPYAAQGYRCTPVVRGEKTSFTCKLVGADDPPPSA